LAKVYAIGHIERGADVAIHDIFVAHADNDHAVGSFP
jgi:hypothetical protein